MLVTNGINGINGINGVNRVAISTDSRRNDKYSRCRYSRYTTTRNGMAIHFHRLSNLQQLSTRA
jgi:hypothetical protein